uniref:Putative ovule protein n=1 Tax=Solanum chacoense TaxID=4108 RepID=A0A0V0H9W7_SOLCH
MSLLLKIIFRERSFMSQNSGKTCYFNLNCASPNLVEGRSDNSPAEKIRHLKQELTVNTSLFCSSHANKPGISMNLLLPASVAIVIYHLFHNH